MKKIISILLVSVILLQSFSKMWILLSFKVNQDYIAQVLCINRDKPQMHCNGNCILMQRMKAAEEQEKQQIPKKLKDHQEVLYCFAVPTWQIDRQTDITPQKQLFFFYQSPFSTLMSQGVFRPPCSGDFAG